MRPDRRPPQIRRPLPLTSLIDVVFLLLLFFMLASVFDRQGAIAITTAASTPAEHQERKPAFVRLHADGDFDVNGLRGSSVSIGEAVAALDQGEGHGAVVQVREGVRTQMLVDALMSLDQAGIRPVAVVK